MSDLDTVVHYLTQDGKFGDAQEAREAIADLIQSAVSEECEPLLRRIDALEAGRKDDGTIHCYCAGYAGKDHEYGADNCLPYFTNPQTPPVRIYG